MLRNLFSQYAHLSLAIKITISTLTSIFAGAGFIGFISEYATYYYAISNGARLPVEGVPYLQMTITMISVILLFSIIIILLLLSLYFYITGLIFKVVIKKEPSKTTKVILFTISMIPVLLVISVLIYYIFILDHNHVYLKAVPIDEAHGIYNFYLMIITFGLMLMSLGFYVYPKTKDWFMSLTVLMFSFLFSVALFNTDIYTYFLQKTKLGGWHEITIESKEKVIKGRLFLVTKDNIMISNEYMDEITEIPKGNIDKYYYKSDIQTPGFLGILLGIDDPDSI